ncbi:hypothetical protein D3C85_1615660 [compost metagenome]
MLQALAHGLRLGLVAFGQGQVVEQAKQSLFNMSCDRAVSGLGAIGQGVLGVLIVDSLGFWLVSGGIVRAMFE